MRFFFFVFLFTSFFSFGWTGFAKEYKRDDWKHWSSKGNCLNTRAILLKERSLKEVTYKKRKDGRSCTVERGLWRDFYYNEQIEEAGLIDIDHIVPLHHAHQTGGSLWSSELKEIFANDPQNLAITNRKYNRQKGAKTPLEWMPIDQRYACRYMRRWKEIKKKYSLNIEHRENEFFELLKCETVETIE